MIECKFTLDLSKNGIQKTVHAKAGEQNARKLIITLTQSGNVYDITNHTAEVYFESNTYSKAKIVGNTVEYVLPDVLEEGVRICELKIYRGTQVIFSPMFELIVEKSIGHTAEATALGKEIHYQKDLADAAEKSDAMQDEDYVIVYDYDKQTAMKLPWSKVKDILVVKNHSSLEGRDAENQHPILAITGLQDVIDEFVEAVEGMSESISENAKVKHTHLYQGAVARIINEGESNKDVLDALSTLDGVNLYFNGKKVRNDNVLTDEQKDRIEATFLAMHKHTSVITDKDNLYVLEGFSEVADLRPAYFDAPLAFLSDVNGGGFTEEQAEILNKLGETDGNLTFDGKPVGAASARPTAQKVFTQDDMNFNFTTEGVSDGNLYICFFEEDANFPIGTEIVDIEVICDGIADGEYFSLKDMYQYGKTPYIPLANKVYLDENYGYILSAIYFPKKYNDVAQKLSNFEWTSARITYYTD